MKIAAVCENHFQYSHAYFIHQGFALLNSLLENGVTDKEIIRGVIGDYLFGMAVEFDQYYIIDKKISENRVFPTLCFRKEKDIDGADSLIEILFPDGMDEMHGGLQSEIADVLVDGIKAGEELIILFDVIVDNGLNGDISYLKNIKIIEKKKKKM